jgi:MFS transporter, DHA1 family, inner membrane transport protein
MFVIGTDSFVIAGLLPQIAKELDIDISAAGQLVTVYALSYATFTIPVAALTSHLPRERVLLAGLIIFLLGNLVVGFSLNFFMALFGRALAGFGAAMFAPLASATAVTLVMPDRRARALAFLMIGLSTATAFGAPIGTLIGTMTTWRTTLLVIATLATFVTWGVYWQMRDMAPTVRIPLRERIEPIRDLRVLLTLLSTFLVLAGLYVTYTFISVVFDRVTRNDGTVLAALLSVLGVAGTLGSLIAGRLTDRFGSRIIINVALTIAAANFLVLPWTSANLVSAIVALLIWGLCGWGFVVPQQHRLIGLAPQSSSILLALYASSVYAGTSASGIIGGGALVLIDHNQLPLIGAGLIVCGLIAAEYGSLVIRNSAKGKVNVVARGPALQ